MAIANSPLRYPGGKQVLSRLVGHVLGMNGCSGGTYIEPYAGGAGVALALLFGEYVENIIINDADPAIASFWRSIFNRTDQFLAMMYETPLTIDEWGRQRAIYLKPSRASQIRLGFATFYLNRCNRSGIVMNGGPIGGKEQLGKWKIDARFNHTELERRIRKVADYKSRISVHSLDAIELLTEVVAPLRCPKFVYLDPPYYNKGRALYLNYYEHDDHARLSDFMRTQQDYPWMMTYDDVPEIRQLYSKMKVADFGLDYSAHTRGTGAEVCIWGPGTRFPASWTASIPRAHITSAIGGPAFPAM